MPGASGAAGDGPVTDSGSGQGGRAPDSGTGPDAAADGALVGLARAGSVRAAVEQALSLTSGLSFIRSGDTVLLKPNLNSGDPYPYSTNPEVVGAVIGLVRDHGAGRVIVADRSNPSFDTMDAMRRSGIYDVAQPLGVEILDLDTEELTRVTPSQATHWPNGYEIYRLLVDEVDHVINLPACKHHGMANFTMALKAWMGIIPQNDRRTAHDDLGNRLPELHLSVAAAFTILDATRACLTGGPMPGGEEASPDIIVATADPVACDVTGLSILKYWLEQNNVSNSDIDNYTVWSQPQIVRALELGIGLTNPSEYEARASGIDEFDALLQLIQA